MMKPVALCAILVISASASFAADPELKNPQTVAIMKAIAGKENEPAEKVFLNIKTLKGIPAGRFLRIMELGYNRALGVDCNHCHLEEEWAVDDKRAKKAARDMITMTRSLNEQLAKMSHLDSNEPRVSCMTCHRGSLEPVR